MADKKISQLPVGNLDSNTIFPIVTSGVTSQTTFADIQDAFGGGGGSQDFDQVLGEGNTTTKEYYNEYIHSSGLKMQAGSFTGDTNNPFPLNGVKVDYGDINPGQFVRMGFGIGEGPFIQVDFNDGTGGETIRKYFYFDFDFDSDDNGHRILTDVDVQPIYRGVFNQEGTNSPVVTEFSNTTNINSIVFDRADEGVYVATATGEYISYINVGQNYFEADSKVTATCSYDAKAGFTSFYIYTYSGGFPSDNVVTNMLIEIGAKEIPNP